MIIYFIRHGFSCANVTHMFPDAPVLQHALYKDPPLSEFGMKTSEDMRKKIPKEVKSCKFLVASTMNRAIMTAHQMFPRRTINVMPYIKELGTGLDQTSMNMQSKRKVIKNAMNVVKSHVNNGELQKVNMNKFLILMRKNLKDKREKRAIVVSHSGFMSAFLGIPFPNNNSIWKVTFNDNDIITSIKKIHNGVTPPKNYTAKIGNGCIKK